MYSKMPRLYPCGAWALALCVCRSLSLVVRGRLRAGEITTPNCKPNGLSGRPRCRDGHEPTRGRAGPRAPRAGL